MLGVDKCCPYAVRERVSYGGGGIDNIIRCESEGNIVGEEVNISKISCDGDRYQVNIKFEESGKGDVIFIRKDALFALLSLAEADNIKGGGYVVG